MDDDQELRDLFHQLVNKSVSTQSLLHLLAKSNLDEQQVELVQKSQDSVKLIIDTVKKIREKIR
jgi:hypothetical protein